MASELFVKSLEYRVKFTGKGATMTAFAFNNEP